MMRKACAIILLLSSPAMAAEQFDLICTAKGSEVHYRIDLSSGEYCEGGCSVTKRIADATTNQLKLEDTKTTGEFGATTLNIVNRVSGEWAYFYIPNTGYRLVERKGVCNPAPFSSFGSQQRKF